MIKIRTDRTQDAKKGNDFGNNFIIAEQIWDNSHNPLLFKDLILKREDYYSKSYFKTINSNLYEPQRFFNSFVKSLLLEKYKEQEWVIDLGGGRGADLFRYVKYKMNNILKICC